MIPYGRQSIDDDDVAAVVRVLHGDWLTQGPAAGEFEDRLRAAGPSTPSRSHRHGGATRAPAAGGSARETSWRHRR